jgi:hypothetical protein
MTPRSAAGFPAPVPGRRFEPSRLTGKPVDVLVTVMLDFWIR